MTDHLGADMRKVKTDEKEEKEIKGEIAKNAKFVKSSSLCFQISMRAILNC